MIDKTFMEHRKDLVSIIIPVRNRREELQNCLKSLRNQSGVDYEIIILNDAGAEEIETTVKTMAPRAKIINTKVRRGPSFLRNLGILNSSGKYLLFLDSDTLVPDDGLLERMVRAYERDERMGSIGGEIFLGGNKKEAFGRKIRFLGQNPAVGAIEGSPLVICDYLATCNCFVSRGVAFSAGGFDPYFSFGAEDKDFGFRIKKAGWKNFAGYGFGVFHLRTPKSRLPDETLHYHITNRRFVLKNLGWQRFILFFLSDLLYLLTFYPILPAKICYKKVRKIRLARENFTAPYLILKAYAWNLKNARFTIECRTKDFLRPSAVEEFVRRSEREQRR